MGKDLSPFHSPYDPRDPACRKRPKTSVQFMDGTGNYCLTVWVQILSCHLSQSSTPGSSLANRASTRLLPARCRAASCPGHVCHSSLLSLSETN